MTLCCFSTTAFGKFSFFLQRHTEILRMGMKNIMKGATNIYFMGFTTVITKTDLASRKIAILTTVGGVREKKITLGQTGAR